MPVKEFEDKKTYCNFVSETIVLGIVPLNGLLFRSRNVSNPKDPIILGIVPVRRFRDKSRLTNFVTVPIALAIVPVSLLMLKSNLVSADIPYILAGIVPVKAKRFRVNSCKFIKLVIIEGNVADTAVILMPVMDASSSRVPPRNV